ncbi:hypothetical protein SAMN06266787_1011063 [Halorubrum ezzemoulense]|uniref:DUF1102 domain-containing protein n=1 Tax=Halorubrum ezzemoulense TaxID=337243 RepID=A0A238V9E7_HALEZ|nr:MULTISPECIES: hypothetical protein [Halorubrum]TKX37555.1 hypothetical protein EXE52_14635 [Halorubrum sp. CGM4_25_10-8A]SNR30263.1 hypothetical protein SAMN06266787_1011063 [Halorubrum ezzemoulense]
MKRRNLILLLGGASSGAMSVGTGAFSSMEAERGVSVDVVKDSRAFVGYKTPNDGSTVSEGDSITLVTVTNRFNHDLSIAEVEVGEGDDILGEVEYDSGDFGSGKEQSIKAPVSGIDSDEPVGIEVTVTVEGSGVTAQLFGDTETRRFTIEREDETDEGNGAVSGSSNGVDFSGGGNAEILGEDRTETVDVYLISPGKSGSDEVMTREDERIETKHKIRGQLSGASGNTIVGVKLDDTVYVHPQWSAEDCGLDQHNNGGPGETRENPPSCESD